jgi:hypothetical protein
MALKLLRKLLALLTNTFVADCPKCNKHFYGFHAYKEQVSLQNTHYRYVCHRCVKEKGL